MKKNQVQTEAPRQLSLVKVDQLNKQPIIESAVSISDDGKWLIHRTVITDIKPVTYFEKVLASAN